MGKKIEKIQYKGMETPVGKINLALKKINWTFFIVTSMKLFWSDILNENNFVTYYSKWFLIINIFFKILN